jgi:hypothetical protein
MNVKLSHEEVLIACAEWMFNHHGLVVSDKASMTPRVYASHTQDPEKTTVNVEFPGIEPVETKPETPYRG